MMILIEALKGGMAELRDCPDLRSRLSTAAKHARIIAEDLAGQVSLIPFAAGALVERRRARRDGRLLEVRYGPRERQVADVWIPERREKTPLPIAIFFHGGTWTAGDKWHLGPSASRLSSRCGCVVVVPNYSLYDPSLDAGISDSVRDAVDAVRWAGTAPEAGRGGGEGGGGERSSSSTSASTASPSPSPRRRHPPPSQLYGGDHTRLAVVGHSAGAHLAVAATMVLSAEDEREGGRRGGGEESASDGGHSLPRAVVALAGPFDLPSHYEHEARRGVHRLSTMARAAASPRSFASEAAERSKREGGEQSVSPSSSFAAAPEHHRASLVALSPLAAVDPGASLAKARVSSGPLARVARRHEERRRTGGGERRRPQQRFVFISSAADDVVPSSASEALHSALVGLGEDSRHVEYPRDHGIGHADFVVREWFSDSGPGGAPWAAAVEEAIRSL